MSEAGVAQEPILDPELPIVDPHHHLWDRRLLLRSLPPPTHGFSHTMALAPYYMLEELLADVGAGHRIEATVFVECRSMWRADGPPEMNPVGETEFVNGVAAMSASGGYGPARTCAGIVGHVDLTLGDGAAPVLEAHLAAGGGRFRGVRHSASWDADPDVLGPLARTGEGLYRNRAFREGFARLAPLGLSFDAWVLEPQIRDVIDLARAFPDTSIVLDHLGTPLGMASYAGQRKTRFAAWRDSICALAEAPNVAVKLGGLAMTFCGFDTFMAQTPASSERLAADWRPYVETCIEAFGAERCMFESNFPVDRPTCSYAVLWNAFKRLAQDCSADEKAALFSGTASRVYRLPRAGSH
ncbi:MAG: amidohydrolase family protein [Caulobacteraceae bacterium]